MQRKWEECFRTNYKRRCLTLLTFCP